MTSDFWFLNSDVRPRWDDVAAFEFDLESNLLGLQRELLDETYRPGA